MAAHVSTPTLHALPTALTRAETEVLMLVASGLTNDQISAIRMTAERTTRQHIYSIMQKLNVCGRLRLALWAWRNVISVDDAWATLQEYRQTH